MMIPAAPLGEHLNNAAAEWEPLTTPAATPSATITYVEFAAAVKDALRDVHSPDLLARNPLLRDGLWNFGASAGPQELTHLIHQAAKGEWRCSGNSRKRSCALRLFHRWDLVSEAGAGGFGMGLGGR
jgi:hypothetical protein